MILFYFYYTQVPMSNHDDYDDGEKNPKNNPGENYAYNPPPKENRHRGKSNGKHTLKMKTKGVFAYAYILTIYY